MADKITLLYAHHRARMTKVWRADGSISDYDKAYEYGVEERELLDLHSLAAVLDEVAGEPSVCAIRGCYEPVPVGVSVVRTIDATVDRPHHWFMLDVDRYEPLLADPVADPLSAIFELLETHLPELIGASFYWQLSPSAGHAKNAGKLKCHLFFWSDTAYDSETMSAWARTKLYVDSVVMRQVQPMFIAAPVFEPGIQDPVAVRSGFEDGVFGDTVDLRIDPSVVEQAAQRRRKGRQDMVDPTTKPGIVGAFCRLYSPTRIIEEVLADLFEFGSGSDYRITWALGGGAPEGVAITDDGLHLYNSHHTDPFGGRAVNVWDFVRQHRFGHLDSDELEALDTTTSPSQRAMFAWASSLPDVQGEMTEDAERRLEAPLAQPAEDDEAAARLKRLAGALRLIEQTDQESVLTGEVAQRLQAAEFTDLERNKLVHAMRDQLRTLGGVPVTLALARKYVLPPKQRPTASAPDWLADWVYVTDGDKFYNPATGTLLTATGFRATFNREMPLTPNGGRMPADVEATDNWKLPTVDAVIYAPGYGLVFEMLGRRWANQFNEAQTPEATPIEPGMAAITAIQEHMAFLLPDARERELLLSWMAFNVQHPGRKIRWAPYVHGVEGCGKSLLVAILGRAMGATNVKVVHGATLESPFNDWAVGAAVIAIEEMKQHGNNRMDAMNRLKLGITNDEIDLHGKNKASRTVPNFSNYLMLSNYLDGAPVDEKDRRYFFVSCAVSEVQAAAREAAGTFERLAALIAQHAGSVRSWLLGYPMHAEFSPNGRAPMTETKRSVIEMSKSDVEQEAADVFERGAEGVSSRVVSTWHLAAALKRAEDGKGGLSTRSISALLARRGFRFFGRVKWQDVAQRVWVAGDEWGDEYVFGFSYSSPEAKAKVRDLLDATRRSPEDDFPLGDE